MRARHGRVGKGARRLAGPRRRVDPGCGEEAPADRRQLRRKGGVGREHRLLRLVPGVEPVVILGQRRIAIPERQCLGPEPARLQPVIAVRELRVAVAHRGDQRVDHPVLDKIPEIARRDRPRKAAPAVLDLLVLGEGVGNQRQGPDVFAQDVADAERGVAPHRGVAIGQQVERFGLGQLPPAERKSQSSHRLVEEPHPGGPAGDRFLVQQRLDLVRQLVRAKGADVAQPRTVAGERGVGGFCLDRLIVELVDLQREEQERRRNRIDPLLHGLKEAADFRVGEIAGMGQRGKADDARARFLQALIGRDGGAELGPAELGKAPLIAPAKGLGVLGQPLKILGQGRAVAAGVEVGQIPFRQRPQRGSVSRSPRPRLVAFAPRSVVRVDMGRGFFAAKAAGRCPAPPPIPPRPRNP